MSTGDLMRNLFSLSRALVASMEEMDSDQEGDDDDDQVEGEDEEWASTLKGVVKNWLGKEVGGGAAIGSIVSSYGITFTTSHLTQVSSSCANCDLFLSALARECSGLREVADIRMEHILNSSPRVRVEVVGSNISGVK